jgi:hypothetical protein
VGGVSSYLAEVFIHLGLQRRLDSGHIGFIFFQAGAQLLPFPSSTIRRVATSWLSSLKVESPYLPVEPGGSRIWLRRLLIYVFQFSTSVAWARCAFGETRFALWLP